MAEDETPSVDAAAEETAADEAREETGAEAVAAPEGGDAVAPPAPPPPREPAEVLTPKERRRRRRASKAPAARGPVSPAERQAERDALRAAKAVARRAARPRQRSTRPARATTWTPPEPSAQPAGRPKSRQGIVVSDKAEKTITVRVDTTQRHRRYKKIVRLSKTLHAHDERNEAHEGDLVRVIETRPLSATKRWRLVEILERAR
jgi:small subunit ribosomal protein S17